MHRSQNMLIVVLAAVLLLSGASAEARRRAKRKTPEKESRSAVTVSSLEQKIHALINGEREKNGLAPLEWDERLGQIARKHSQDMATRDYFSHISPEGHDFSERYEQEGYTCGVKVEQTIHMGAENIFQNNLYGSVTTMNGRVSYDWISEEKIAETTVAGWMKSPGHRKNILTPHGGKEGIGVSITPGGKVYITQNFC